MKKRRWNVSASAMCYNGIACCVQSFTDITCKVNSKNYENGIFNVSFLGRMKCLSDILHSLCGSEWIHFVVYCIEKIEVFFSIIDIASVTVSSAWRIVHPILWHPRVQFNFNPVEVWISLLLICLLLLLMLRVVLRLFLPRFVSFVQFFEINSNFPVLVCCVFIFISFGYHRTKSPKTYRNDMRAQENTNNKCWSLVVCVCVFLCHIRASRAYAMKMHTQFSSFPFVNPCSLSFFPFQPLLPNLNALDIVCSKILTATVRWDKFTKCFIITTKL